MAWLFETVRALFSLLAKVNRPIADRWHNERLYHVLKLFCHLMERERFSYMLVGGLAASLLRGKITRKHKDIDVKILIESQENPLDLLSRYFSISTKDHTRMYRLTRYGINVDLFLYNLTPTQQIESFHLLLSRRKFSMPKDFWVYKKIKFQDIEVNVEDGAMCLVNSELTTFEEDKALFLSRATEYGFHESSTTVTYTAAIWIAQQNIEQR